MKPELIIMLIIFAAVLVITVILIKKQEEPNTLPKSGLPDLKSADNDTVAFRPIESLSPENEKLLSPIKDKMIIQRIIDTIPKTAQIAENGKSVVAAKNLMDGEIYQAIIPQGAVLDHSRAMEGAYRGSFREVANSYKGQANFLPVDESVRKLAAASAVNSIVNVFSLVVGQYYMGQINLKLETVNSNISSIRRHMDEELYSKVMRLVLDVKHVSDFRTEIFNNDRERQNVLNRLSDYESDCEQLLIQVNTHLSDLAKSMPVKYESYENDVRNSEIWYQYHCALIKVMSSICELKYVFNNGGMSKEYTHSKLYSLVNQSIDVEESFEQWHQKNIEKFGIDIDLKHRERKGLNAIAWKLPGMFNDELNYKQMNQNTISAIKNQTVNMNVLEILPEDPYKADVVIIEKGGEYFYLPPRA